jgi:hypothetical protein
LIPANQPVTFRSPAPVHFITVFIGSFELRSSVLKASATSGAADEMIFIEALELVVPHAARHRRHVVDVGSHDRCRHGGVDVTRLELVTALGFPKGG